MGTDLSKITLVGIGFGLVFVLEHTVMGGYMVSTVCFSARLSGSFSVRSSHNRVKVDLSGTG